MRHTPGRAALASQDMDPITALTTSINEFESRLRQVGHDQWDLPTPCSEWTVRDLVNHILLGTRMTVELLDGTSKDEVISRLGDDLMNNNDDPVGSFVGLAGQMRQGFAADGGLEGTVDHPMGELPRTTFIGFRILDNATHAWDLARATGAPETLDGDLVQRMWDDIQPMAGGLGDLGIFGDSASGTIGDDAPLQVRFLDLVGRSP